MDLTLKEMEAKIKQIDDLKLELKKVINCINDIKTNTIIDVPLSLEQVKELPFIHYENDITVRNLIKKAGGTKKHGRLYISLSKLCDYLTDGGVISDSEAARLARLSSNEVKRRLGVIQ